MAPAYPSFKDNAAFWLGDKAAKAVSKPKPVVTTMPRRKPGRQKTVKAVVAKPSGTVLPPLAPIRETPLPVAVAAPRKPKVFEEKRIGMVTSLEDWLMVDRAAQDMDLELGQFLQVAIRNLLSARDSGAKIKTQPFSKKKLVAHAR